MVNRDMKDSGVEWIGDIPEKWEVIKAKRIFNLKNEKNTDLKPLLSVSKGRGLLRREDMENRPTHAEKNLDSFKIVNRGDFVIHLRSFQSGFEYSEIEGAVSPAYTVFNAREKDKVHSEFYKYLFYSKPFIDKIASTTLSLRDGKPISYDAFSMILIPVPNFNMQQKIAAFLDEKVAHIDSIIEDTKQSIENLKAYKQSLITETVTKGLDPDVEMKDSEIEWIGEIPNNWEVSKVKYFFNIRLGKQLQPKKKNNGDSLKPYLRAANVDWKGIDTTDIKKMWFSKKETENYKLEYGDLIVSEGGDAGRAAIYKGELPECYVQNAVHRVRGENTYLLYYWLFAAKSVGFIDILCNKATFMHFTVDKFREFPYLKIPEGEQREIINFLDNKSFEIDTTIYQKEQLITELESYKKSLIYEYVTGKKEVK